MLDSLADLAQFSIYDDDDSGSDELSSSLAMLRIMPQLMGGATVVLTMLSMSGFIALILYAIARWRQHRDPVPDPQLGLKFALGLMRVLATQIALVGGFLVLYSLAMKGDGGTLTRTGMGLVMPAGLVLGVMFGLIARTNDASRPMVTRLMNGWNLVQTGVMAFAALLIAFQGLLQKDASEVAKIGWCMSLVYGGAWAWMATRFFKTATTSEDLVAYPPPPPAPPPPPGPVTPPPPETYAPT